MPHEWREHPKLQGRFHPECPGDLQVIVHDGGPRMSHSQPELVWVRVTSLSNEAFSARVLNQPQQLVTVREGSEIQFIVPEGGEYPISVTVKYLSERSDWLVQPCNVCGLTELFDAPSDLIRKVFPDLPEGATMESFTAFCGMCGGVQVVQHKGFDADNELSGRVEQPKRWWQFWR